MSSGRVQALAIATRPGGQVVYERFYEAFSEGEKGEIRGAFDAAAGPAAASAPDDEELVGRYRCGAEGCMEGSGWWGGPGRRPRAAASWPHA